MQVWTHHPSSFRLDAMTLRIYPEQGQYWAYKAKNYRYREMARMLWESIGTNQFLWCCTVRGTFVRPTEDYDLMEWEIAAPPARIIAHINAVVWENLVRNRSDCWDGLILDEPPASGDKNIHVLVAVPLPSGCVTCHGQLRPQYSPQEMARAAELLRNPPPVDLAREYDIDAH